MKPADSRYLAYAANSIDLVVEWTAGGREQFLNEVRTQAAVLYWLQTLTQALRDMTDERRARYPEVPFRAMSGLRTVIVHDYLSLEMEIIWSIVEEHIPLLKPQIARMLAEL